MNTHPNSIGINHVALFPEIFEENIIDFQDFGCALPRKFADYLAANTFLFGSQANKDINMIFSAVQRLYGQDHKDFLAYIQNEQIRSELLSINDDASLLRKLEELGQRHSAQYGMRRIIHSFYINWLDDQSKQLLLSKITKGKANRLANNTLQAALDILLSIRNKQDHSATYNPLANTKSPQVQLGKKGQIEHIITLTFPEFYEATRKAMAAYWLNEYKSRTNKLA